MATTLVVAETVKVTMAKLPFKRKEKIDNAVSSNKLFENIFTSIIKYSKWLMLVAMLFICFSGVYKVDTGEVAVVLRFGKLVGTSQENQIQNAGLHLAFPYIIDEVVKIPVDKIQEQSVVTHYKSASYVNTDVKKTGYLITGDENIVLINSTVKYKISNPVRYALFVNDLKSIIDGIMSAESTALVAGMTIDHVLTSQKTQMGNKLKNSVQSCLDNISCGIEVTNIELTTVVPPKETASYFTNVNTASIKKETLIKVARQYATSVIPESETSANRLIEEARINGQNAIIITDAEMSQFYGLYAQYLANPDTIENGIFRERVSVVLAKCGAVIIIPKDGNPPMIILP